MTGNYVLFFVMAVAAIMFVSGIILAARGGKYANMGKVFVMLPVAVALAFATLYAMIIILFSTADAGLYLILLFVAVISLYAVVGAILWRGKGVFSRKWVLPVLLLVIVACVGIAWGHSGYKAYVKNNLTLSESDGLLRTYAPFAPETKVAELDGEALLTIETNIPRMDGATALFPIYSAFAKAVYPRQAIDPAMQGREYAIETDYLRCRTTTDAYRRIVDKEADIIFVAGPSEAQEQYARDNGVELVYTPIGREAFVFFVNAKNPLADISVAQIQGIYSGQITKWNDLGIKGLGEIRAFQRDEGSGSQTALTRFVMRDIPLMTPPKEDVIGGMGGIISRAADYVNYKNSIGFSFRFYSTEMVKNNKIKLLSVGGVYPSLENIENGSYALASEFYAVTRSDASENTKKLVEWITGEQGKELIQKTGYTPYSE